MTNLTYDHKWLPRGAGKTTEIIKFIEDRKHHYDCIIILSLRDDRIDDLVRSNSKIIWVVNKTNSNFYKDLMKHVSSKRTAFNKVLICDDETMEFSTLNMHHIDQFIQIHNPNTLHIMSRATPRKT